MKSLLPVFLFAVLPFFGSAQVSKTEADIAAMMKEYNAVGLSVAVVKENEIVFTGAFGYKNLQDSSHLAPTDIFRIASISKSFSATTVMQLVEAKKLSLKDDFSKLIGFTVRNPNYPNKVITLKMVLSHTSSINDSQGYFNLDAINPAKNPNWAKCYNAYAPGKGYMYCNLNYNMTGAVIEKISGQRFDQRVKDNVLGPLGLYGGYWVDSLDSGRFATLYDYDSLTKQYVAAPQAYAPRREEIKNYVMGYSTPIFSPTGGMKISAVDLARYMTMHMNYGTYKGVRILSKKSSKRMQKKVAKKEGYGLALETTKDLIPGEKMTGHTGSAYGLYSAMFFNPKKKFGIVVIFNGADGKSTREFRNVLRSSVNILYNDLIK